MKNEFYREKIKDKDKEVDPEQIAQKKLESLMSPNFNLFAVRFVNIGEFREIIERGDYTGEDLPSGHKFGGGQVYVVGVIEKDAKNFIDYLERHKSGDWIETAEDQTDWFVGSGLYRYKDLLELLWSARKQVFESQDQVDPKRSQTLSIFREKFLEYWNKEVEQDVLAELVQNIIEDAEDRILDNPLDDILNKLNIKIGEDKTKQLREEIKSLSDFEFKKTVSRGKALQDSYEPLYESSWDTEGLRGFLQNIIIKYDIPKDDDEVAQLIRALILLPKEWSYIKEATKILKNFFENPKFLEDDKNLRVFFNAVTALPHLSDFTGGWIFEKGYNIALILDIEATYWSDQDNIRFKPWSSIRNRDDLDDIAKHVKGAIVIMSNRNIVREVIELSSHSGLLAHPVFNNRGKLMWPR